MFIVAVAALILGYAMMFTGARNLKNGGQGPSLVESLGFETVLSNDQDVTKGKGSNVSTPSTQSPNFQQI